MSPNNGEFCWFLYVWISWNSVLCRLVHNYLYCYNHLPVNTAWYTRIPWSSLLCLLWKSVIAKGIHEWGQELWRLLSTMLIFGRTALRFTCRKKDALTLTIVKLSHPSMQEMTKSSHRLTVNNEGVLDTVLHVNWNLVAFSVTQFACDPRRRKL